MMLIVYVLFGGCVNSLHFPGNLVEDDDSRATYDPSSGQFTVKITKETKGEHFEDLDLLTKLLARKGEASTDKPKKPLIEVIGETSNEEEHPPRDPDIQEGKNDTYLIYFLLTRISHRFQLGVTTGYAKSTRDPH